MITIIHGDDLSSSRNFFSSQKQAVNNPLVLDGEKITLSEIIQVFEGGQLFSEEKNVFIESFFSKRKPGKEFEEIINCFKNNSATCNLYFWESRPVSKKSISLFPRVIEKLFKLPKALFLFLDCLQPKKGVFLIKLFRQTLETTEIGLIFYMLLRHFRLLLALLGLNTKENIEEIQKLQSWQKNKLKKQLSYFTIEYLKKIYNRLYQIDFEQKTGKTPLSLASTLDFFLLEI